MNPSAEDFAFSRLIAYAAYQWPGYRDAAHHRLIARHLEKIERGEITRLMITMPPRHGKSMLASEFFPAWYMGRNPDHYVVTATYAQDLADDFGRKVKNQIEDDGFKAIFPGVGLADDSKSAKRFHIEGMGDGGFEHATTQRGAYYAVGIGGPLTGRGAHLLLIDDPVKNREDADSEVIRKKTKDWYTSTAYTRLMPGGRIVVIQCMTGDTLVLMADGAEKPLRDVARGDSIASYDNGRIVSTVVLNHRNNGPDSVFQISMSSGKTVKANERHPFLVERDGVREWIRLKDILVGDHILTAIGASGADKSVPMSHATSRLGREGSATRTTTNTDGRRANDRLPVLTQEASETSNCDTDMALISSLMKPCLLSREGFALSADVRAKKDRQSTGPESFALTITTTLERLEGCSATTATLLSAEVETRKPSCALSDTWSVTSDKVLSILPCGVEDVYDIQVEGTENFIANGLVSHNTRWHEDDLSGWLLNEHEHEDWTVLNLPAISDDGEALWPEQYPVEQLRRIQRALPPRDFSALYQQKPQPDEGTYFKREWFDGRRYNVKPALHYYGTSDLATKDGSGDYTVHHVWGVDAQGDIYLVDRWREQTTADVWIERQCDLIALWKPLAWFTEAGPIWRAVEPALTRRMRERKIGCRVEALASVADKPTSARGFQSRAAMKRVWLPDDEDGDACLDELLRFPTGKYDDEVDACSKIGRALDMAHPAIVKVAHADKNPADLKEYRRRNRASGTGAFQ